mmetsp:Transcript_2708/g.7396  ORF Transcript_2708/g.7396 Transcript_2708/m.7396 type:complete len:228 (+) Transcript_2708:1206-1889(+)
MHHTYMAFERALLGKLHWALGACVRLALSIVCAFPIIRRPRVRAALSFSVSRSRCGGVSCENSSAGFPTFSQLRAARTAADRGRKLKLGRSATTAPHMLDQRVLVWKRRPTARAVRPAMCALLRNLRRFRCCFCTLSGELLPILSRARLQLKQQRSTRAAAVGSTSLLLSLLLREWQGSAARDSRAGRRRDGHSSATIGTSVRGGARRKPAQSAGAVRLPVQVVEAV